MTLKTLNQNRRAETLTKTSVIEEEVEEYEAKTVDAVFVHETS